MKILRGYKTELDPNNKQRSLFHQMAGATRYVFNWGLATWQQQYEAGEKPSQYGLCKQFNAIKRDQCPWILDYPYGIVDSAFLNLGNAFKYFFRRVKNGDKKAGYPKFKSRFGERSFALCGIKVFADHIRLPCGLGNIRLKEHGYIPVTIKDRRFGRHTTFREKAGRWYVSVLVETSIPTVELRTLTIGLDIGLKTRAVLSTGQELHAPKALYENECKLSRLNRELSRRTKGGCNWRKTKQKVARQHAKIANIRKHWLHQISHYVTYDLRPGTIVLETLNVSGMLKNKHLSKSVSDAGFYELRRQIEYKAAWLGIEIVLADMWYASSKTCSECGNMKLVLGLAERTYVCEVCGATLDRDLNAARNLAALAA